MLLIKTAEGKELQLTRFNLPMQNSKADEPKPLSSPFLQLLIFDPYWATPQLSLPLDSPRIPRLVQRFLALFGTSFRLNAHTQQVLRHFLSLLFVCELCEKPRTIFYSMSPQRIHFTQPVLCLANRKHHCCERCHSSLALFSTLKRWDFLMIGNLNNYAHLKQAEKDKRDPGRAFCLLEAESELALYKAPEVPTFAFQ